MHVQYSIGCRVNDLTYVIYSTGCRVNYLTYVWYSTVLCYCTVYMCIMVPLCDLTSLRMILMMSLTLAPNLCSLTTLTSLFSEQSVAMTISATSAPGGTVSSKNGRLHTVGGHLIFLETKKLILMINSCSTTL